MDSCMFIYSIEDLSAKGDAVRARFAMFADQLVASPLVELECRVGPLRDGNAILLRRFERAFARVRMLDMSPAVYRQAATVRARYGTKAMDSLHLATAQVHECDSLWTNDLRLQNAAGGLAIETF
ncbi:PIN domain-containing protein [Herbiconiux sp. CPCC 205763]|uniref:PIN domain-containing protein n=1 Tax=Herbiconiux aconitum TaxID=2970913 RepID=A0ABT2GL59_9MICO|nr:PIN domain-containing protein [Herbiconiux aconitum]